MSENNYESFTFIDSDCNSTSELDPNRELNEKVTHLHLVLKFYFSPLDTVSKRCLLKCLLPFVPKKHVQHYHKLVADLFNGLTLERIHNVQFGYLRHIDSSYKKREKDHSLDELRKALGLSGSSKPNPVHKSDINLAELRDQQNKNRSQHNLQIPSINNQHVYSQSLPSPVLSGPLNEARGISSPAKSTSTKMTSFKEEEFDIEVKRKFNQAYGFRIKGGTDTKESIFVEEIGSGSQAEKAGLKCLDQVKSINGQSLNNFTNKEASKLIRSNKKLKMKILRKLPPSTSVGTDNALEYDEPDVDIVPRETELSSQKPDLIWVDKNGDIVADAEERFRNAQIIKVLLVLPSKRGGLGFRIRGGAQYGIGIFISNVHPNSIAARHNLQFGDQILAVNNENLNRATHEKAIELISMDKVVLMSIRRVGCIPELAKRANTSNNLRFRQLSGQARSQIGSRNEAPTGSNNRNESGAIDRSQLHSSMSNLLVDSDRGSDFKSLTSTDVPILSRNTSPATASSIEDIESGRRYRSTRQLASSRVSPYRNIERQETLTNRFSKSTLAINRDYQDEEESEDEFLVEQRRQPPPTQMRLVPRSPRRSDSPKFVSRGHHSSLSLADLNNSDSPEPRIISSSYDDEDDSLSHQPKYHYSSMGLQRTKSRSNSNLGLPNQLLSADEEERVNGKGVHRQTTKTSRDVFIPPLSERELQEEKLPERSCRRIRVEKVAGRLGLAIEGGADTHLQLPTIIKIKPDSCAWFNDELKVGMRILEVNNKPLYGLTHAECGKKIAQSFQANFRDYIEFLVEGNDDHENEQQYENSMDY